ncbi:hypothetical protein X566_19070 [Afipia sp. P52-10]|nr:hypothetical protein X566_19070 [Afipia sp. P52-10]
MIVTGGTPNAIEATVIPGLPTAPGQHIYILVPTSTNTGPVTISVEGEPAVPIKSTFGTDLSANSILADVPQLLVWSVDHYALLTPAAVDADAILATVVAAKDDAEDARDAAVAAAAGVSLPSIVSGSAGKVLQVNAGETAHELVSVADVAARTFGLKALLSAADWADVRDATNVRDIASPLNARIAELAGTYPGCTIDATAWRGETVAEVDLFNGITAANIRLITGKLTLRKEMNQGVAGSGAFRRPSYLHWEMHGTVIKPLTAITGNVASPNDSEKSMVSSWLGQTTGTGAFNQKTVTVDNPAIFNVGARIAIEGLSADSTVAYNLSGNIDSSTLTINLSGSTLHTINGGHVYVQIDNEIILGAISTGGVMTVAQRGANGSTAASHTSGTPVYWSNSLVTTVMSVVGSVVTVSDAFPNHFTDAVIHVGAIGHKVSGEYLIDGEFDEGTGSPSAFYQCMGSVLSTGCTVSGRGVLRRAPFAGLFEYASAYNKISLDEVATIGRPSSNLGGGIWIFGQNLRTKVRCARLQNTVNACFIDDKSESAGLFGLERPNNQCSISIECATNLANGFGISGSRDSRIRFGFLSADVAGTINNNEGQRTSLLPDIRNNVVTIESDACGSGASGDVLNKDGNRVRRLSLSEFLTQVMLGSTNIPANGANDVNFSVPGSKVGAAVSVTPLFAPLGGIAVAYAYVVAPDSVKVGFTNSSGGDLAVAGNLLISVRNG